MKFRYASVLVLTAGAIGLLCGVFVLARTLDFNLLVALALAERVRSRYDEEALG